MDGCDGRDDAALAERCAGMTADQRRHTAVLALWRLRAPLLMLGLDPAWGTHRTLVDAVFRALLPTPGDTCAQAVAELTAAPFFADPQEGEPDGTAAETQMEVLVELARWRATGGPAPEDAERIVGLCRALSRSVDLVAADSLWDHPARHAHARYLATAAEAATGYHAARNRAVEAACDTLVAGLPPGSDLPDTAAGREALALCEAFSAELAATLAWCTTLGR
ncbi:hypothetical protein ACIRBY_12940 [Streptomyces sp. NPDC096136]|uniref:hypothetical protein n=1 Tax=Streptomyces sp. NPDC096136 TaxID=3366076 RepID=UPI0037F99BF6